MKKRLRYALSLIALCGACFGQEQASFQQQVRQLRLDAKSAREKKDWAAYQKIVAELNRFLPDNPGIVLSAAHAAALLGDRDLALARLKDAAKLGVYYDVANDEAFKSRASEPPLQAVVK